MPRPMVAVGALLLGGAFFPPAPRVAAFTVGIIAIIALFGREASRAASRPPDWLSLSVSDCVLFRPRCSAATHR